MRYGRGGLRDRKFSLACSESGGLWLTMAVPNWRARLVCGACGCPRVDMVVTGTERR